MSNQESNSTTLSKKLRQNFFNSDVFSIIFFAIFVYSRFFYMYPSYIPSSSMTPTICTSDAVIIKRIKPYQINNFFTAIPHIGWRFARMPYIGWRFLQPKIGDSSNLHNGLIITFFNGDSSEYCKRVIALPGQHVWFDDDDVMVDNESIMYDSEGKLFYPETEYIFKHKGAEYVLRQRTCRIRVHSDSFIEFKRVLKPSRPKHKPIEFVVPQNCIFVCGDNPGWSFDSRFQDFDLANVNMVQGKVVFIFMSSKYDTGLDDVHMSWTRFAIELAYKILLYCINIDLSRIASPYKWVNKPSIKPLTLEAKKDMIEKINATEEALDEGYDEGVEENKNENYESKKEEEIVNL